MTNFYSIYEYMQPFPLSYHAFPLFKSPSPAIVDTFETILDFNVARKRVAGKNLLACLDQKFIGM